MITVSGFSEQLREVRLPQGVIRYRDVGDGPVLVFVHGILVNSMLWRDVVERLQVQYRCIVPDLPLGNHSVPMGENVDLTPKGVARIVTDLIEVLGLEDVTLVGNNTGGSICQIVISEDPRNISRLVLTNCDAYEAFLPLAFRFLFQHAPRIFGIKFTNTLAWFLRFRVIQRGILWTVSKRRPDISTLDSYMKPLISNSGIREDLTRFLSSISNRYTLEAARSFGNFRNPVLLVWAEDDFFFLPRYAERLRNDFPDATLEHAPNSRAFVPEDQPCLLAERIERFVSSHDAKTSNR